MKALHTFRLFLTLLCVGAFGTANSQTNLITNGNLETRNSIPQLSSNIGPNAPDDLPNWDAITWQIGYYLASDGAPVVNPNSYGASAHSGMGCALVFQHDQNADHEYDVLMTQQLAQPLLPGHRYLAQFWTLRADDIPYRAKVSLSVTNGLPTFNSTQNTLVPSPGNKTVVSPETIGASGWFLVSGFIDIPQGETTNQWVTIGADRFDHYYDDRFPIAYGSLVHLVDDISIVDVTLTGSSTVCGTSSFTFYVESGANVVWSASPSSLFTVTQGYGSTFTTSAVGTQAGQGTISATFISQSGSPIVTKTVVVVGAQAQPDIITGNSSVCYERMNDGRDRVRYLINTPAPNGTYYHSELVSNPTGQIVDQEDGVVGGTFEYDVIGGNYGVATAYTLRVRIQSVACFSSWRTKAINIVSCSTPSCQGRNCPRVFRSAVSYPNPASDVLIVPSTEQNAVVTLFDGYGTVRKQIQVYDKSAAMYINVVSMPSGIYMLRIENDDKSLVNSRIVIQH